MSGKPKRIGVLTGGGDCPGLNAVIRAVCKTAMFDYDLEVFGIEDGYLGLIQNRIKPLTSMDASGILTRGGTILGTSNKANPAQYAIGYDENGDPRFEDVTDRCLEHLRHHHIDALVLIGGDGTMSGAAPFIEAGINCIGCPKTIDNDLVGTDLTFGFLTAVETATEAIDRLHTTAMSHHRVIVVEVMGRNAGWIALHSGVASGSDVILIPEIPYDLGKVCEFVEERSRWGKRFSLICIAEGAKSVGGEQVVAKIDPTSPDPVRLGGIAEILADDIERVSNIETRAVILGHVIRGGTPISADRVLATQFGHHAIEVLMNGESNRLVVCQDMKITDIDIRKAANKQRMIPADHPLIRAARAVGTCFGD